MHTGYGTEGAIPDAIAKRIIENEVKPPFQQGDYFSGINAATDAMILALAGEYKGTPQKKGRGPASFIPFVSHSNHLHHRQLEAQVHWLF